MVARRKLLGTAAVTAVAALLAPAAAQEPSGQAASAQPETADNIVVTATRVSRSGFDAPTPTKVLTTEAMEERARANVGDFLNEIPAFRSSQNAQTNPQNSTGAGQTYADLRSLGNIRTLTLVDGRRHVPSAATGQVDLNLIPTSLVERVEVVTGGASAAWGSDAVSGVVNVILDKNLRGLKGEASYGVAEEGDNAEKRISLGFGGEFAEGRGRIIIGGDYVDSEGVDSYDDRAWGRRQEELVSYTGARPAGEPSRFYASGVQALNMAFGGVILGPNADTNPANGADVLRGIQFGPGGTVLPFEYGTAIGVSAIDFTGGNPGLYARNGHQLVIPLDRRSALAHVEYDVTDSITLFVEGGYGRSAANFHAPVARDQSPRSIVIQRDNAFLPAEIAAIMDANGITSFPLGRSNNDFGEIRATNVNTTERFVGGAKGVLRDSWSWDAYYQYGRNTFDSELDNHRIEQNFQYSLDAVLVGGQAVCRDAAARAAGCAPINLFGVGSPSAAAIDYVTGTQFYKVTTEQEVGAINLRGEPLSTWAGPVSVAFGGEFRRESARAVSDEIAQMGGFRFSNPQPFEGGYNAKEVYFETVIPLAKDLAFARSVDLNGAVRYTDYSTSGGVTTWKVGGTWEPLDGMRFRATRSRDIRAPNNAEIFASTSNNNTLRNPFNGVTAQISVINQSSPTLEPEKADTKTFGVVYAPSFVNGLQFSVDYYDIDIEGAIAGYSPQLILDNCANEISGGGAGFFCGFVERTGTGPATTIDSVSVQLLNIASLKARGIDFDANYRFDLGRGAMTARLFGTYTIDLISDDGIGTPRTYDGAGVIQTVGSVVDRAGQAGGFTSGANSGATNAPHWVLSGSLTYALDRLRGTVHGRYVGGGSIDNTLVGPDSPDYDPASPISIADNRIDGRFYLNLGAAYDVFTDGARKLQVYGVIDNVTDAEPPFPASGISGLYDRVGRSYKIGVRFAY